MVYAGPLPGAELMTDEARSAVEIVSRIRNAVNAGLSDRDLADAIRNAANFYDADECRWVFALANRIKRRR